MIYDQQKKEFLEAARQELQAELTQRPMVDGKSVEEQSLEAIANVLKAGAMQKYVSGDGKIFSSAEEAAQFMRETNLVAEALASEESTFENKRRLAIKKLAGATLVTDNVRQAQQNQLAMGYLQSMGPSQNVDVRMNLKNTTKNITTQQQETQKQEEATKQQVEAQAKAQAQEMNKTRLENEIKARQQAGSFSITGRAPKKASKFIRNAAIGIGVTSVGSIGSVSFFTLFFG